MLMSRSCSVVAVVLICLTFSSVVCGQQDFLFKVTPFDEAMKKVVEMAEVEDKAAAIRLKSITSAIERFCDLSEEQKLKLKVAAKGVIEKRHEARVDELAELIRDAAAGNPNTKVLLPTKARHEIDADANWDSVLDNVLSGEQRDAYKAWRDERQRLLRTSVVGQFIAEIDIALLLTAEQRKSLTTIIEEEFGDELVRQFLYEVGQNRYRKIDRVPTPKYLYLVEGLLSEDQLEEWKKSVEYLLQNLK